ncbi:MAG: MFS transporter [Lachnospiraceae bacterium]|nr:MFS transporter [Lachnospiraceae bacterium]
MEAVQTSGEITYSKTRVRLMLFAVVFVTLIHGFGQFKLIPMQDAIQTFFGISEGAYGIMGSAQNWLMIALSIPLGLLARKIPCKWSFSMGYVVAIGGMLMQIFARNFVIFVIGRMLEGGGFGFITLTTGSLILTLVKPNRRGFWASVNSVATVLPQILITKVGSSLMQNSGMSFQGVFAIICGFYGLAVVVWLIIVPRSVRVHGIADSTKPTKEQTLRVYKNKTVWLVSIAFCAYSTVSVGFTSFVIKVLCNKGLSMSQAANTYSLTTIIGMAAMIVFGLLADKFGTKRKIVIAGFLACALAMIMLAILPANLIFIYVALFSTVPRSISGLTNSTSADIAEVPTDIPVVSSVRTTITKIGSVVMTILMGFLIQHLGYEVTLFIIAGECAIAAVLWFFAKKIP